MKPSQSRYRAVYHIIGGLIVPVAALFLPRPFLLISLGTVTFLLIAVEFTRLKVPAANRWFFRIYRPVSRSTETSRLTGATYLLGGSFICFMLFPRDIAFIALSYMAIGDALAGVVGRRYGKRRLFGKTLEGDLACFLSSALVGVICYYAGLDVTVPAVLVGAFVGAAVEGLNLPLNDNLTMPVFAGAAMTLMQALA